VKSRVGSRRCRSVARGAGAKEGVPFVSLLDGDFFIFFLFFLIFRNFIDIS